MGIITEHTQRCTKFGLYAGLALGTVGAVYNLWKFNTVMPADLTYKWTAYSCLGIGAAIGPLTGMLFGSLFGSRD